MAKVLIVDDDFEIVSLLTEILKVEGHQVDSASEPVEGMQKARGSSCRGSPVRGS